MLDYDIAATFTAKPSTNLSAALDHALTSLGGLAAGSADFPACTITLAYSAQALDAFEIVNEAHDILGNQWAIVDLHITRFAL
ncbi:MAG: hypothetical protein JOZ81_12485 [Chloroflexi bacterium]|nr:hypothetical protein [Chloroflexota bacterium]